MKHIRILILVVILAGMSSCGISTWTTTKSTARSFVIEPNIQQMPTVADLVVDTVYVRKDTTWTNNKKATMSKEAMRELLIGAMLEEASADVIIQPRENVVVSSQSSKQTLRMEMYGYPARYRNFRTATEQDLKILNGIDPQPVNNYTIYIGSDFQKPALSPAVGTVAKAVTPAPEPKKKPKKPAYLRKPFYVTVEAGYNFFPPFGMIDPAHGFVFNNTYLWRMKNHHIYEGVGIGLNSVFGQYDNDNDAREWHIPIYWHNRFYFGLRKYIPYFDFRLGSFISAIEVNTKNDWSNKSIRIGGGLYYAAFLGMEFGKHVNIAIGTDQFFGAAGSNIFKLNACVKMGVNF